MEYKALYDFTPNDQAEELPFKKGSILKVIKREDKHWLFAHLGSDKGLIPENYVKDIKGHPWYVGMIKRCDAEKYLMAMPKDGAFMVRDSESTPGDFSLSVKFGGSIQHFKILKDEAGKYFLWVVKHQSINALIEFHQKTSVSRSQQILLTHPCCLPPDHNMSELISDGAGDAGSAVMQGRAGDSRFGGMQAQASPIAQVQQQQKVTRCKALYDFQSDEVNELCFTKGEIITLLAQNHHDWWEGEIRSGTGVRHGIFPRNYVSVL